MHLLHAMNKYIIYNKTTNNIIENTFCLLYSKYIRYSRFKEESRYRHATY